MMTGTLTALDQSFAHLRQAEAAEPDPTAAVREERLRRLERALVARREAIVAAIDADFSGRLPFETLLAEIYVTLEAFRHARKHLRAWMKPRRRSAPLTLGIGRASVRPQPLGIIGVMAPWNYPVMLALAPIAGAIAAGNRVMLKPAEATPKTSVLLAELIEEALGPDVAATILGDASVGAHFAALPFDHLVFTGSTRIGRLVAKSAAENLTPVTLELGGKSPALVLPGADLAGAAADIAFGKFTNAGQTCIAPDYVLVPRAQMDALVIALRGAVTAYFGTAMTSVFPGQMVRMRGLIEEARARKVRIEELGPTIPGLESGPAAIIDPPADIGVSQHEIFGPLLPVVPYDSLDQALDHIRKGDQPLAFYVFGTDRHAIDRAMKLVRTGAMVINDSLIHAAVEDLPFGGVGASGIGRYRGRDGFDRFSNMKAVYERLGPRLDRLARPPAGKIHQAVLRWLIGT
jgi:acyl-CoA reductase-like NAD-dependent aldehyde dehydrogenase